MKKNIFCLLILFLVSPLFSSSQTQDKVEIEVEEARSLYQVISTGDRGLLIGFIPMESPGGIMQYKLLRLGNDLKVQSSTSFQVPEQYKLISNYTERQYAYLLFSDNAGKLKRYLLVRVNTDDLKLNHFNGTFKKPLYFKELLATNGVVYLGGTMNNKPYVGSIDMMNDATNITDFIIGDTKKGARALNAITVNDANRSCYLLVEARSSKAANTVLKQISNYKFCTERDMNFPEALVPDNAKINVSDSSLVLMAGTYGTFQYKEKAPGDATTRTGIFYGSVNSQNQSVLHYFPYNGFTNFKMDANSETRNLMVNFHDFIMRKDETILVGEVFYPVYENDMFRGYHYSGAVVIALDKAGNFKWENGLQITDDNLSNNTSFKFRFTERPDGGIKVVYSDNNIIRGRIIYNGNLVRDLVDVKPVIENVNAAGSSVSIPVNGVEYWYGNNYLVYAAQKINRNASEKESGNKTLFYFNRISLID